MECYGSHVLLIERIQQVKDNLGDIYNLNGIKVVEDGGMKLEPLLTISDPWETENCLRDYCLICNIARSQPGWSPQVHQGYCPDMLHKELYLHYNLCNMSLSRKDDKVCRRDCALWLCEINRHLASLRNSYWEGELPIKIGERRNPLYKHHKESQPEYWMKILGSHVKAMSWQIEDSIIIKETRALNNVKMNSKAE